MTIDNLCALFTESWQSISVWSLDEEKEIFHGTIREVPFEIREMEIYSIDALFEMNDGVLTINVE